MNDGTTPLILAARLAVEGMVAELINCQADVNAVDDHGNVNTTYRAGQTFCHGASKKGWASAILECGPLINSVAKSDPEALLAVIDCRLQHSGLVRPSWKRRRRNTGLDILRFSGLQT